VVNGYTQDALYFLTEFGPLFKDHHGDELQNFETVTLPQHVLDNPTAKLYRGTKYRLPLNTHVYYNLLTFLETNAKAGGTVIIYLLQTYCEIRETARGPIDQYSFEAIVNQARGNEEALDLEEGIPGAFTGVTNKDIMNNRAVLKLGMMPMDYELAQDVRSELEEEDIKHPPESGKPTFVEEFDRTIKREESPDAPSRNEIPLPPSRARDVVMEIQKIKENRDRFKIESRTGGIGPAVSVCMFTFHNTLDT
jgi:transcription initiation factor TFIID subunit 5